MTRRTVSGVLLCGLLFIAVGCSGPQVKQTPGSCAAVRSTILVQGGVRYLYIELPDGNQVIVNVDALSPAGSAAPPPPPAGAGAAGQPFDINRMCPCEEDGCTPMCRNLSRLMGTGPNLCTPPL